jgi:hypothetical protein
MTMEKPLSAFDYDDLDFMLDQAEERGDEQFVREILAEFEARQPVFVTRPSS